MILYWGMRLRDGRHNQYDEVKREQRFFNARAQNALLTQMASQTIIGEDTSEEGFT